MNRRLVCHQSVGGLRFSDVNRLMEEMEKEMSEAIRGIPEVKVAYYVYGLRRHHADRSLNSGRAKTGIGTADKTHRRCQVDDNNEG